LPDHNSSNTTTGFTGSTAGRDETATIRDFVFAGGTSVEPVTVATTTDRSVLNTEEVVCRVGGSESSATVGGTDLLGHASSARGSLAG
jgi:hypothetical protein